MAGGRWNRVRCKRFSTRRCIPIRRRFWPRSPVGWRGGSGWWKSREPRPIRPIRPRAARFIRAVLWPKRAAGWRHRRFRPSRRGAMPPAGGCNDSPSAGIARHQQGLSAAGAGRLAAPVQRSPCGARCVLGAAAQPDSGAGRRVRLGQDHHRHDGAATGRAFGGGDSGRWGGYYRDGSRGAETLSAADAGGVSRQLFGAGPDDDAGADRGGTAAYSWAWQQARANRTGFGLAGPGGGGEQMWVVDVWVKEQIINVLQDLQAEMGLSILFISHDLSVVRSLTDEVAVMFNGRIVEQAPTEAIFTDARHAYTRSLLDAVPVQNPRERRHRTFLTRAQLEAATPRLAQADLARPALSQAAPQLVAVGPDHWLEAVVT